MSSCNLTSFPDFLRYQYKLKLLELSYNDIYGKIPRWIWNTSTEVLEIDDNSLTSFDIDAIPSDNLRIFYGSRNNLTGPLPALPPSIVRFRVLYNQLSGEISPLMLFNLSFLERLDLSHNKLSGVLPNCLRNNIKRKVSSEKIPQMCFLGRQLRMMDLSHNQFQGRLPRSLAQFMQLEVLKLQNNQINDVFPSWLGTLPKLKVLLLRSNHLNGSIKSKSNATLEFPSLRIIDLSCNNFSGLLSYDYFQKWEA